MVVFLASLIAPVLTKFASPALSDQNRQGLIEILFNVFGQQHGGRVEQEHFVRIFHTLAKVDSGVNEEYLEQIDRFAKSSGFGV